MKWETVKLEECCLSISDGDHQPPPKVKNGIPFVTISDITSTNQFSFENAASVPQEYYDGLDAKRKAQSGDVLYSVVGSFGIPILMKETTPFVFQRHIAILRPNPDFIDPRFLYYTMLSREFYAKADAVAIGSAQRTVGLTALRKIKITIPPIPVQHEIADTLSGYDNLIENNQKQIKLLEEAAQRLYKEWFVDLRFPGYEDTPVVDGVPKGWKKTNVGSLIGTVPRTKQILTSDYLQYGAIPIIDQGRDFIAGYTNDLTAVFDLGKPVIVFGDHTRILKYIQFPFAKGADGTQLLISIEEDMPQSLLYCSIVNIDLSNYNYARHYKYLKAEEILVPTTAVAKQFDSISSKMFGCIQSLRNSCSKAKEARDRLLPKLMSGEAEVKK